MTLVPFPVRAAEAACVVLGRMTSERVRANLSIDVMVMAFAAIFGGALVCTSDVADLERIAPHFPSVRVLGV